MLYLDSALELHGLTVFRDYNRPDTFHYMPGNPEIATDGGDQALQLLIYRRDITDNPDFRDGDRPGGGFLTMTVDLKVSRSTLDAVKSELQGLVSGGEVNLLPVMFDEGTVRVSTLGVSSAPTDGEQPPPGVTERGPRFVEEILGSAKPSMYADNRAVFQIELSHEGAQLMRASLEKGGTTQVAVVYDLAYRGMMPAFDGTITIDFKQSYSYLRSRFTMNTLWFKADIDAEMEKLRKEGHITIKAADYLQSDPAKLAEQATKLQELAKELGTWAFFKPGLTPGKVVADDRGNVTVYDPTATAAAQSTTGPAAAISAVGTGTGSPTDVAGPRTQGVGAVAPTARVGGQPAPPPTAAPASTPPAQGAAGSDSAVDAWNKMGRPQAGFLLRQLSQEEQQLLTFDLRQVAVQRRTAAPQGSLRTIPGSAAAHIEEVDLQSTFFERIAGAVTTTADFTQTGVGSMVVKLRYGVRPDNSGPKDTFEATLTKAGDSSPYAFFMDHRTSVEFEYQVVVTYRDGFALGSTTGTATSDWIPTTTRNLDINPEVVGAVFPVALTLGSIDWNAVQGVQSTVRYAAGEDRERTIVFSQTHTGEVVPIRPPVGGTRDFTVETTFFYAGSTEVVVHQGSGASTVVINPPTTRAIPVSISATDPLGRLDRVTVEVSYPGAAGQPEQTRILEFAGGAQAQTWTFFRRADDPSGSYRYRVTRFGKDGTVDTDDWQQTPERQLIVGDVFEAILTTEIRFLVTDFTAAGFQGAKLTLEYPDAAPGTDGTEEEFFTGTPAPFIWRVPRRPGGGNAYRYTVLWVRSDGTQQVVGPTTSSEELLMIFPPARG